LRLSDYQHRFTFMLAHLILWAYEHGYEISMGEVFRTKEQAELNAKNGTGIANSLHCMCLAADLNLFKDGVYLTKTEDHRPLGEYWESLGGSWGGRFGDGNHYSLSYNGIK
jgi:hypothetical protein